MWGSWLAAGLCPSRGTPCALKRAQFTVECTQKPWHKTRRFLLFCRLVAVETCNKGQPSSSGIIVQPLFSRSDTCLNKWLEQNNVPFPGYWRCGSCTKRKLYKWRSKMSMLCLFVCYYILRFCKTCIFFFHNVKLKVNKLFEIFSPWKYDSMTCLKCCLFPLSPHPFSLHLPMFWIHYNVLFMSS